MDLNEFHPNPSIQLESLKATMNALRSKLDQEKEMLKNDIVETLKCQSILGTGSADLLYTSGLLARLKSLEDNREPLPGDHGETISAYCLKSQTADETRKSARVGEIYQPVRSRERSSNCIRPCCAAQSAGVTTSGVQIRTFSSQNVPPPSSFTHHSLEVSLPRVDEDPERPVSERPNNSWSGDAAYVRPVSKGYPRTDLPKSPKSYPDPQIPYNYRPAAPSYQARSYPPTCKPSSQCTQFLRPSFTHHILEPQDIPPDSCNRHCLACCTRKLPEVTQSAVIVSENRQEKIRQCRKGSAPHCRHRSPNLQYPSEASPMHYPHHHQKAPRYNRHQQSKKEDKEEPNVQNVSRSTRNKTSFAELDDLQEQRAETEYTKDVAVATEVDDLNDVRQVKGIGAPSFRRELVTPKSSSPGSTHSGNTRETLVYEEPQDAIKDTVVQCHYANELSSQKSGGSSLFGSETVLEELVHPTSAEKKSNTPSSKPRRRGAKRSTRDQGTNKSGKATYHPGDIERTSHKLHCQLENGDPSEKATCETATTDLTKGRAKDHPHRNSFSPWSSTKHLLLQPTMHHTILPTAAPNTRKKMPVLKNDPLKSLETFYANLAAMPRSSSKMSKRNIIDDRLQTTRDIETNFSHSPRKKTSRPTRSKNPFSLIFDELRSSPMLRNMGVSTGRKSL